MKKEPLSIIQARELCEKELPSIKSKLAELLHAMPIAKAFHEVQVPVLDFNNFPTSACMRGVGKLIAWDYNGGDFERCHEAAVIGLNVWISESIHCDLRAQLYDVARQHFNWSIPEEAERLLDARPLRFNKMEGVEPVLLEPYAGEPHRLNPEWVEAAHEIQLYVEGKPFCIIGTARSPLADVQIEFKAPQKDPLYKNQLVQPFWVGRHFYSFRRAYTRNETQGQVYARIISRR